MSEECKDCGDSVAWGSGKYVNRLPAESGFLYALIASASNVISAIKMLSNGGIRLMMTL